jgi:hypothetical protein
MKNSGKRNGWKTKKRQPLRRPPAARPAEQGNEDEGEDNDDEAVLDAPGVGLPALAEHGHVEEEGDNGDEVAPGDNRVYLELPHNNPGEIRRGVRGQIIASKPPQIKCLLCQLENIGDRSKFFSHCHLAHPDENERILRDERIVQCRSCEGYFLKRGLSQHLASSSVCKAFYQQAAPPAPPPVAPLPDGAPPALDADLDMEEYTEIQLLAPFGTGCFHIHKAWEEPLHHIMTTLLKTMVPGEHCYISTLAFTLIPGMITFIQKQPNQGRVVDFLTTMAEQGTSAQMGIAIKAEAIRLLRCKERGECEKRVKPNGVEGLYRKANGYVRAGRFSPAARIVTEQIPALIQSQGQARQEGAALSLDVLKQKTAELHPSFRNADWDTLQSATGGAIDMESEPAGVVIDKDEVWQGVKNLPTDSAQGGDGWTNNALKWFKSYCRTEAKENEAGNALTAVVNAFTSGTLPDSVIGLYTRTRLVLIPKNDGSDKLRPIAMRGCFYRLICRVIAANVKHDLMNILIHFGQLAIGLKGGCEIGALIAQLGAMQAIADAGNADPRLKRVSASTDCRNCFNSVSRRIILDNMRHLCPGFVRTFLTAYGSPSDLFTSNGEYLGSAVIGVAQGCPLAMSAACIGLHTVYQKAQEILDDEEVKFYNRFGEDIEERDEDESRRLRDKCRSTKVAFADDFHVTGIKDVIAKAMPLIKVEAFGAAGLELVDNKGHVFDPSDDEDDERFGSMRRSTEGMVSLGCPIGTREYRKGYVNKVMEDIQPDHKILGNNLLSFRHSILITGLSINAKPEYLKRVVDPEITVDPLKRFDESIDTTLQELIGADPTTKHLIEQYRDIRGIGLGMRRHAGLTTDIGFRKGQVEAHNYIMAHCPQLIPSLELDGAWPRLNIGERCGLELSDEIKDDFRQDDSKLVAKACNEALKEYRRSKFDQRKEELVASENKSGLAWLQSKFNVGGVAFWESMEGLERGEGFFPSAHCKAMVRLHMGCPLLDAAGMPLTRCRVCERERGIAVVNIEKHYTHSNGCRYVANFTRRHDDLRDLLMTHIQREYTRRGNGPNTQISKEVIVHEGEDGAAGVKMDIVIREGAPRQRVIWVDVSIPDAGAPMYTDVARGIRADEQPGAAAASRESVKKAELLRRIPDLQDVDSIFYAFVVETSGRLGERSRKFLRTVIGIRDGQIRTFEKSFRMLLARHGGRSASSLTQAGWAVGEQGAQGEALAVGDDEEAEWEAGADDAQGGVHAPGNDDDAAEGAQDAQVEPHAVGGGGEAAAA